VSTAVRSFTLDVSEERQSVVSLELAVDVVRTDQLGSPNIDYVVNIGDDTKHVLEALGCTPPDVPTNTYSEPRPPYSPEDFPDMNEPSRGLRALAEELYGLPRSKAPEPKVCSCVGGKLMDPTTGVEHHRTTCDMYRLDNESPDASD
jgi:hypothetical protein